MACAASGPFAPALPRLRLGRLVDYRLGFFLLLDQERESQGAEQQVGLLGGNYLNSPSTRRPLASIMTTDLGLGDSSAWMS